MLKKLSRYFFLALIAWYALNFVFLALYILAFIFNAPGVFPQHESIFYNALSAIAGFFYVPVNIWYLGWTGHPLWLLYQVPLLAISLNFWFKKPGIYRAALLGISGLVCGPTGISVLMDMGGFITVSAFIFIFAAFCYAIASSLKKGFLPENSLIPPEIQ